MGFVPSPNPMKFAIFGDIHANLEALQSVLWDAREQGCESHACLGDIVGYAANPSECLEVVRELNCPAVRGNHDDGAAGTSKLEELNPLAQAALCITGPLMWWKRRPTKAGSVGAPRGRLPIRATWWLGSAVVLLGLLLPLFGVTLVLVLLLDQLVLRRVPQLKTAFDSVD